MQVLSLNVGRPQLVKFREQTLSTAIYKRPVEGSVQVGPLGLEGDDQADKSVHGGIDKAVYAYAQENYDWWQQQFDDRTLAPGDFGENLTLRGLVDDEVQIGDRYRMGTTVMEVTQPRQPCMKLGIKMQLPTFVKTFHQAGRPGFYLRVIEPGTLSAGDQAELLERPDRSLTIAHIYQLRFDRDASTEVLRHAAELSALSDAWRSEFCELLESR